MGIFRALWAIVTFMGAWTSPRPVLPPAGTLVGFAPDGRMYICGFAPIQDGVLTATHCIRGKDIEFFLLNEAHTAAPVNPIWGHFQIDIALMAGKHAFPPTGNIGSPDPGERLCYRNHSQVQKCGFVGIGERTTIEKQYFEMNFYPEVEPGDSGSGVFDADGRLVGIVSMYYVATPSLGVIARTDTLFSP